MRRRKTDLQLATEALDQNDLKALSDVLDRAQNLKSSGTGGSGDGTISIELWNAIKKYIKARNALDDAKFLIARHGLRAP